MSSRHLFLFLAATALALLSGCNTTPSRPDTFASQIEARHGGVGGLYNQPAVHTDVRVEFGGNAILDAALTFEPHTSRSKLETRSGGVAVFDGEDVWSHGMQTPTGAPPPRFHLLTWSWFLSAPWKLQDPGSHMDTPLGRKLRDERLSSARMTYDQGVGDSSDDWYIVYANEDQSLAAVAYIVTFGGKSVAEANKEPHAATYDRFEVVDGLRVPVELTFWNWNEDDGLIGDPIGKATFQNVRFAAAEPGTFDHP